MGEDKLEVKTVEPVELKAKRAFDFDNADLGIIGLVLLGISVLISVGIAKGEVQVAVSIISSIITGIIALAKIRDNGGL